jgi:hypothetical protein
MTLLLLLLIPLGAGLLLTVLPEGRPPLIRAGERRPLPSPSWRWGCWPGASRRLRSR